MILVIDTSSALSAIALLDESGAVVHEELHESGRTFDLARRYRVLEPSKPITRVAVATGPGSFTGLRVGVAFGLGLAIGLRLPIVPLPTLAIQAARSETPVTAVAEAGRGRVYHLKPDGQVGLAEPAEMPHDLRLVGWLRESTRQAALAAGLRLMPDSELFSFGEAAARILESAGEVPYGSLKLQYMQSYTAGV